MDLTDISGTLTPKSNQINAEDLLAGPAVVQVERVTAGNADHPIAIHLVGYNRPWLPCLTTRRLLVACWGKNATEWPGRWVRLFCDPEVVYGGKKVGGVRFDGASHIDRPVEQSLTVTRGKRRLHRVEPISPPQQSQPVAPSKQGAREDLADALAVHNLTIEQFDGWAASINKPTSATMEARPLAAVARMIANEDGKGPEILAGIRGWVVTTASEEPGAPE